jgi:hypothetical protein
MNTGVTNQLDPIEQKDVPERIRQFLTLVLSPGELQRLDALIQQIAHAEPWSEEGGERPDMMEAVHEHLEQGLTPEEMSYLSTLISQLDQGPDPDEHRAALENMAEAARRRREASGTQENSHMYAYDEASDLRSRLRAVGCPVGPYGSLP